MKRLKTYKNFVESKMVVQNIPPEIEKIFVDYFYMIPVSMKKIIHIYRLHNYLKVPSVIIENELELLLKILHKYGLHKNDIVELFNTLLNTCPGLRHSLKFKSVNSELTGTYLSKWNFE